MLISEETLSNRIGVDREQFEMVISVDDFIVILPHQLYHFQDCIDLILIIDAVLNLHILDSDIKFEHKGGQSVISFCFCRVHMLHKQ